MKRKRAKPKVLKLQPLSDAAVERLAASLAYLALPEFGAASRHHFRDQAKEILAHLVRVAK